MIARVFALVLVLLVGAPAVARDEPRNVPTEPFHVAGPIWYVGMEDVSAFLITTPSGHVLVDGGYERSPALIEANIRKAGFRVQDVKLILTTHAHFDHAGGLARMRQDTGATVVASGPERLALEAGRHIGDNENGVGRFARVHVDRVVADNGQIAFGGLLLTAHLTPGHTPGCTSWTIPFVEGGVRHTAIIHCSTTVAGNRLVANRGHPGIVGDYRRSFARFRRIQADVFLAVHPGMFDMAAKRARMAAGRPNPFVDPTALQTYNASAERAFEAELVRQQAAARARSGARR